MLSTLLAIAWKPEVHGVVIIIVATVALPGTISARFSAYLQNPFSPVPIIF